MTTPIRPLVRSIDAQLASAGLVKYTDCLALLNTLAHYIKHPASIGPYAREAAQEAYDMSDKLVASLRGE